MSRAKWLRLLERLKERDGFGGDHLIIWLFTFMLMIIMVTALTTVAWLFASKQHGIQAMIVAARQAEVAAAAESNLASGQGNLNPTVATNTFNQVFQSRIGWPSSVYQIQDFTVYTQSQAGNPLPVGLSGNVPGPSIFVQAEFDFSVFPFWNPAGSPLTVKIPAEVLVSPNRYNHPGKTWIGG